MSFSTPRACFFFSSSSSKGSCSLPSGFRPSTTSPYICTKRRYESQAKRAFPEALMRPCTVSGVSPRFSTVSIMPGIEARAPERTETRSGFPASPKVLPAILPTWASARATSSFSSGG